jgi:hypothetical protein
VEPAKPATPVAGQKTEEELAAEKKAADESTRKYQADLEKYYAIEEKELVAQLESEPHLALPKLAAKLHMAIVNEAIARLNGYLPVALTQHSEITRVETEAKNAFYGRWPGLKGQEKQVLEMGRMYRSQNPSATQEAALEAVGRLVYAAMGQPAPGDVPAAGAPAAAPTAPAAPKPKGFRPASPGGGTPASGAPKETNPFTKFADELLEEDSR